MRNAKCELWSENSALRIRHAALKNYGTFTEKRPLLRREVNAKNRRDE